MTDRHLALNARDLHYPTAIRNTDGGFGRAVRVRTSALRQEYLTQNPQAVLADVAWCSRAIAAYLSLDDVRGDSIPLRRAVTDAATASAARLRSALRPAGQEPIEVTLNAERWSVPATGGVVGPPTVEDLLNGLWPALVGRDPELLAFLLGAPGVQGYPLSATTRTGHPRERCLYLWADAWQRVWTGDPAAETVLVDGIEAAVDAQAGAADDYPLTIAYSALCLLDAVARNEPAEFDTALVEGLEFHRRYWDTPQRWADPEGFIAWPLLAVACLAVNRGMRPSVTTGYLPAGLLYRPG
ncbi:immunity 49 family protein [Nocardia concava]|uniref:immunity 49 family protein n=1 Tax=Nocardia concava TaxID=257281 RepID=UPI00031B26EF|nr:immunity 49 family protein [Nocardia concava]